MFNKNIGNANKYNNFYSNVDRNYIVIKKKNTIESSATFENGGQLKKGSEWLFWALNNYKLLRYRF